MVFPEEGGEEEGLLRNVDRTGVWRVAGCGASDSQGFAGTKRQKLGIGLRQGNGLSSVVLCRVGSFATSVDRLGDGDESAEAREARREVRCCK